MEWLKESSRRAALAPHVPRKVGKPEGIRWALTDPADMRTYAYAVREQCSRKNGRKTFVPELIPQSEEPMADGGVQRVFFLMNPSEGGNEVVLLRYHRREKNCQMISAFAQKQVLKVSDKSIWVEAQRGNDLPDEDGQGFSIQESPYLVLLDGETGELVQGEIQYGHSYISVLFQKKEVEMTGLEIGKCYRLGLYDFPVDPVMAADYLERDGSAESWYQIARIYREMPELEEDGEAEDCLACAAEMGWPAAQVETALRDYREGGSRWPELLRAARAQHFVPALVLTAYGLEQKEGQETAEEAYALYREAASFGSRAAGRRLGAAWGVEEESRVKEAFLASVQRKDGLAAYCAGILLRYGEGMAPDEEGGRMLLEEAAALGNPDARAELEEEQPEESEEAAEEPAEGGKTEEQSLLEHVAAIHEKVDEMAARTRTMETQLGSLCGFVEGELRPHLRQSKGALREEAAGCMDEDQMEKLVGKYMKEMAAYIDRHTVSSASLVEKEREHLRNLFGSAWEKMLPETQTSLVSSGVLWKSCAEIEDGNLDYSGVIISATSALETELGRWLYYGFQDYMEETYGKPDAETWPEVLLTAKQEGEAAERAPLFTMGMLPYLFGRGVSGEPKKFLRERLNEYLGTIVKDRYAAEPVKAFSERRSEDGNFIERCEQVRTKFRNKAAHTDIVERSQAEACYKAVVGKIDAYDYTTSVNSILFELFACLK